MLQQLATGGTGTDGGTASDTLHIFRLAKCKLSTSMVESKKTKTKARRNQQPAKSSSKDLRVSDKTLF